ncbi:MAG: serine/threonine protein kinase [Phycisphaerae bacterium]|nr:serine/threonine protein kinase [Phycisphaerae bacterium]
MNVNKNIDTAWLTQQFPDLSNLAPLSDGGQKVVFSATHTADGEVVLKLLRPGNDLETIRRELLAVSQLTSAKVPPILATGIASSQVGDWIWFREKRVHGDTLRARLANGALEPKTVLRLGRDILASLLAAEQARIVHRDVKPENIICDTNGGYWLIDFGIARHLSLQSNTATALAWGKFTLGYAPPEQTRNIKAEIDCRCDLFALGVTLYECATGTNPFRHGARTDLEIVTRVETLPLQAVTLPLVDSRGFTDLVVSMTQKRRDHRPQSVREAIDWMNEICDQEGI